MTPVMALNPVENLERYMDPHRENHDQDHDFRELAVVCFELMAAPRYCGRLA